MNKYLLLRKFLFTQMRMNGHKMDMNNNYRGA